MSYKMLRPFIVKVSVLANYIYIYIYMYYNTKYYKIYDILTEIT